METAKIQAIMADSIKSWLEEHHMSDDELDGHVQRVIERKMRVRQLYDDRDNEDEWLDLIGMTVVDALNEWKEEKFIKENV